MLEMPRICKFRKVILLDSSQNNPVVAKRIKKKGYWYYAFPLYDKDGNEITEEQASRNDTKSINGVRKNA
jgi:hypothetical protein